jgi:signal transduction histidine kinase/PAS domain-containing protein
VQHPPPSSAERRSSSALAQAEGEPPPDSGKRFPFTPRRIIPATRPGKREPLPRLVLRWFQNNSFAPEWLPARLQHPAFGYLAALLIQILCILLDALFLAFFPTPPFRSLFPVLGMVIVTLGWGAAPGIFSILIGGLMLDFFLLPPTFSAFTGSSAATASVTLLVFVGLAISILASQTERTRRELAAEQANLESMFETITDGLFVWDAYGRVVRTNAALRELLSLDADPEYIARPAEERKRLLNPRDEQGQPITDEQWPLYRLLRGEKLTGKGEIDLLLRALDGRDVQVNVSGAPLRDRLGQVSGAILMMRDVTERRALERRTREALEALLAMAESLVQAPSGIPEPLPGPTAAPNETAQRLVELSRRVLGCRRVSIAAIDPATELQIPMAAVGLSPEEEHYWWNEQGKSRLSAGPDPTLVPRLRAGEIVVIDMSQPLYSSRPNPYAIRTVLIVPMQISEQLVGFLALDYGKEKHEFTPDEVALAGAVSKLGAFVLERARLLNEHEEARANELALREANRRMDEFLSIASHELKTPLTSIRTSIQLLQRRIRTLKEEEAPEDESATPRLRSFEELLARADRQAGQLNRLVDDLLDVSRIQTSKLELYLERTDLAEIVREAVQQHALLVPQRTLQLSLDEHLKVPVVADSDRISQVLSNFLTNALKYSPETEPVEIGLEVQKQRARVWVRDHGVGLPLDEQEHIWERFHRAKGVKVQSGSGVGLGIGLFISRTITTLHHGQVGVQSAPGQGSTFWFSLPLAEP